jgi:hypothetical protein
MVEMRSKIAAAAAKASTSLPDMVSAAQVLTLALGR